MCTFYPAQGVFGENHGIGMPFDSAQGAGL